MDENIRSKHRATINLIATYAARIAAMIVLLITILLVAYLVISAVPLFNSDGAAVSLWQPQSYPGQAEPLSVWQPNSTSQSDSYFNITPLLFGTFKAALLGIIIAMPLAIVGAIYTAIIMPAYWRNRVKPVVELMEAVPTVILGFLAAIWLAPLLQDNLLSFLLLVVLLPIGLTLLGFFWSTRLSRFKGKYWVKIGPPFLLLLLVTVLIAIGYVIEHWLFGSQFALWLELTFNWQYQLRNALVVGVMLGLAVAPVIFALAEDALSEVPRELIFGSIALGASRWQTIWRVVVPGSASGLCAAILLGLGRALGETMIILMASNNSPILQASIFQGLRSISATLAIEMPESTPGTIHFQVLLYAAFMLFIFTLLFNSGAELLRQRWYRQRYA